MKARVIGRHEPVAGLSDAIKGAIAAVTTFIATNSDKIGDWLQQGASFVNGISRFLGLGPSYNPANGGEVARQLGPSGTNQLHLPWAQAYVDWIKNYYPAVWNGADMWTAPGLAQNSAFADHYRELVAAGMPEGTLLDQAGTPVGLADSLRNIEEIQQILDSQAQNESGGGGGTSPRPRPLPSGVTPDNEADLLTDGTTHTNTNNNRPPRPTAEGDGLKNAMPLLLGAGLLFFLANKKSR